MEISSPADIILSKIKEFYRINTYDSDERIKFAFRQLLNQWSDIIIAGHDASDDELFHLNVSRGFLYQIFILIISKDYLINDHLFTRDILQLCFTFLLDHIDIFTNKNSSSIIRTFLISNVRLIMEILSNLMSVVWYSDIDLFNEELFIIMREYIDQNLTNDNLTDGIFSFIWNVSDNTILVPILLKTNYTKSLYQWIEICQIKFREDTQTALINILQNMLRHDDAIEEFNQLHILNIIEQIQFDNDLSLSLKIIHIFLTDINQIKLESIEFLNTLIELTINAGENEKYRHNGTHVCELLCILAKLFYNDEILIKIFEINSSIIELFISLIIKFYPNLSYNHDPLENFTCVLLMNIFCCISYHEEYSKIIYNNKQLMDIIQNAINNEITFIISFMPRTMKSIEQTAIEILKNFNEKL